MAAQPLKDKVPPPPRPATGAGGGAGSRAKWVPFAIMALAALVYSNALANGFTNFDDDFYILKNPFLRDFSWEGLKAIFTSFYTANYHPLTTLTYWIEFHFAGLNPFPYHLLNVALHIANTWLVYKLVQQLSGKQVTAIVVSVLFAIHPMHVESVAWISERKDVLYTCFYLLALIAYTRPGSEGSKTTNYIYTTIFFLLALLSKSAAVTLPVLLVAIDIYKGKKVGVQSLLAKAPLFILAFTFGIVAIMSQKEAGALRHLAEMHTLTERFFFIAYGLASYFVRLVAPLQLSAMHNYPIANGGLLPWVVYASLPFLALLGWLAYRWKAYRREVIFGLSFFIITISVMLQVVAVGSALTSERYTYVPYIGLFYIIGQYIANVIDGNQRSLVIGLGAAATVLFCGLSWARIGVWKDGYTLFADVIEKNPDYYFGYWMRGNLNNGDGRAEAAIQDYSDAIRLNPGFEDLYYDRGHAFMDANNPQAAIKDYNQAISINPKMAEALNDRGWAYYKAGKKDVAVADINQSLVINPSLAEAYNNRGSIYYEAGDMAAALPEFNKAIQVKPDFEMAYLNRAALKANAKDFRGAMDDYNLLEGLRPGDNTIYYNRGLVKMNLNDRNGACEDWSKAAGMGNNMAGELLNKFCSGK